jgi:hypothetical protein
MQRIGKFAVGSLVGAVLALGVGGVAGAAPVTTTGATSTPTAGTSTSGTSTPGTTTPTKAAPAKSTVLLGPAIWRAVEPHHKIDCARATKEIKKIQTAMAAASKRGGRWQKRSARAKTHNARNTTKRSTRHTKHSSAKVNGFQKLQQEGAALIKKIDAKCGVSTPAG